MKTLLMSITLIELMKYRKELLSTEKYCPYQSKLSYPPPPLPRFIKKMCSIFVSKVFKYICTNGPFMLLNAVYFFFHFFQHRSSIINRRSLVLKDLHRILRCGFIYTCIIHGVLNIFNLIFNDCTSNTHLLYSSQS